MWRDFCHLKLSVWMVMVKETFSLEHSMQETMETVSDIVFFSLLVT